MTYSTPFFWCFIVGFICFYRIFLEGVGANVFCRLSIRRTIIRSSYSFISASRSPSFSFLSFITSRFPILLQL
ncbi:MAG TPA: hypothetical protein EYN27_02100, partial [Rhodospirillales bacterium]|nr:hypothetical protein [Rhodospirillales bacterium]